MKKLFLIGIFLIFAFSCGGDAGNGGVQNATPTEALKTFLKAKIEKDAETQKKVISRSSLAFLEETAKKQNTTVDRLLTDPAGMELKEVPEMRGEVISGDAATVELQNPNTGTWEKMPLVKEDGQWKIALDQAFREVMKKVNDLMKQMPSKPGEK
ncbi:MAG: hypothetical protein R2747_13895 [Pyrinomonadaceae bacterium]